jgi:hypothetical protein
MKFFAYVAPVEGTTQFRVQILIVTMLYIEDLANQAVDEISSERGFGEKIPNFDTEKEAERVVEAIFNRYSRLARERRQQQERENSRRNKALAKKVPVSHRRPWWLR